MKDAATNRVSKKPQLLQRTDEEVEELNEMIELRRMVEAHDRSMYREHGINDKRFILKDMSLSAAMALCSGLLDPTDKRA